MARQTAWHGSDEAAGAAAGAQRPESGEGLSVLHGDKELYGAGDAT